MSDMRVFALALLVLVVLVFSQAKGQRFNRFTVGTEATLVCSWKGLSDPNLIQDVKWYRKGRKLKESKRMSISNTGLNYTLTIKSIKKSDKGTYICSPETTVDVKGISDGYIKVEVGGYMLPKPPAPSNITLYASGKGQIRCNYGFAKKKYGLKFYWSRNGIRLKKTDREGYLKLNNNIKTVFNSSMGVNGSDILNIENVDTKAAGNYTCNYRYPDGQVFSMLFRVNVFKPKGPADLVREITWGANIVTGYLQCDLSSLKNVTIKRFYWEKDGKEISNNTMEGKKYEMKHTGYKRSITVSNLNTTDSGSYRCVAELEYYPIAVRFNVKVEESRKHLDFSKWSPFSVCDQQGRRFRFRVCTHERCLETYNYVYEVDQEDCNEDA